MKNNKQINLRPWQEDCIKKSLLWLTKVKEDKHFVINAAPGSGKTIAACVIANELIKKDEIDRVIVIAPRRKIAQQWAEDFRFITDRFMGKITSSDPDASDIGHDLVITWQSVGNLSDALDVICKKDRVLVICDEHHHAAQNAAWGNGANSGLSSSKFSLILTGTPIRSDGKETIWVNLDDHGNIKYQTEGSYTLTYGEAVDLDYCRPITFHRHDAQYEVKLDDDTSVTVSGSNDSLVSVPDALKSFYSSDQLKRSLDFYTLSKYPKYEKDNITPSRDSFHSSMVDWGMEKLDDIKNIMPEAGGLVIAPNIEMAEYFQKLIQIMDKDGQKPILVHSNIPNAEEKITAFDLNNDQKWLISVNMVSEGVDIPRLRVLIYLPHATTELYFRQAMGRIVRKRSDNDITRGYAIIPRFSKFNEFAKRVEDEMPVSLRKDPGKPKHKVCPVCETETSLGSKFCPECDHEFPGNGSPRMIECSSCGNLTSANSPLCNHCNHRHNPNYVLSFEEILKKRDGYIARGFVIDEDDADRADTIGNFVEERVINSSDPHLINMIKKIPKESFFRMEKIFEDAKKMHD
jgi:superfamily II DNA or RNA helicase